MLTRARTAIFSIIVIAVTGCVTGGNIKQTQDRLEKRVDAGDFESSAQVAVKKFSGNCIELKPDQTGSYSFDLSDKVILQKESDGLKSYSYFKVYCGEWNPRKFLEISVVGSHAGGGIAKAYMVIPFVFLFDGNFQPVQESRTFVALRQGAVQFGEIQEKWSYAASSLKTRKFYLLIEPDNKSPTDVPRGHTAQGIPFYPYLIGDFKLSFASTEQ